MARNVDYPVASTLDACLALAKTEGRKYRNAEARSERDRLDRTTRAAFVVRSALATGLVYDARTGGDRPDTAKSKEEFSGWFGVVPSQVSFWVLLAIALDKGVKPDSALWNSLAARGGAKRKGMGEAIAKGKSVADIATALEKSGMNPETGEKVTTSNPTPRQGKGEEVAEKDTPVAPLQAAKDHITGLAEACKSPTIQTPEWETIQGLVTQWLASENRRRGTGTKRTRKGAAA